MISQIRKKEEENVQINKKDTEQQGCHCLQLFIYIFIQIINHYILYTDYIRNIYI